MFHSASLRMSLFTCKNKIENIVYESVLLFCCLVDLVLQNSDELNFLQVFSDESSLGYYIDGQSEPENWMKFVNCARHSDEQNLALIQDGDQLFYECCKDILMGEELLVWYGKCYTMSMGIPTGLDVVVEKEDAVIAVNELTGKNMQSFVI